MLISANKTNPTNKSSIAHTHIYIPQPFEDLQLQSINKTKHKTSQNPLIHKRTNSKYPPQESKNHEIHNAYKNIISR